MPTTRFLWWSWWTILVLGSTTIVGWHWYKHSLWDQPISQTDGIFLCVWVGLLCLPLLAELEVAGLTVKSALREIKDDHNEKFRQLGFSLRLMAPGTVEAAPDQEVSKTKEEVTEAMAKKSGILPKRRSSPHATHTIPPVENLDVFLPTLMRRLSSELHRLLRRSASSTEVSAPEPLLQELVLAGGLSSTIGEAIKTLVDAARIHSYGGDLTDAQIEFVKEIGPKLFRFVEELEPIDSPRASP